jgi:hypothetical protein
MRTGWWGGIFGPKRDEIIRGRRKLNKYNSCNLGLHSSPNVTRLHKQRGMSRSLGRDSQPALQNTNLESYYFTSLLGVVPRSFVDRYQRFGGASCLHLQCRKVSREWKQKRQGYRQEDVTSYIWYIITSVS